MPKIGYRKYSDDFNLRDENGHEYIVNTRFEYAILEKLDEIRFEKFGQTTDYSSWDKGRLFGESAELKWYKKDGLFHQVVITDEDSFPRCFSNFDCSNLRLMKDNEGNEELREIFLWGRNEPALNGWVEPRISRILNYPMSCSQKGKRLKIVLREYQFEETPAGTEESITSNIYRFMRLIPADDD